MLAECKKRILYLLAMLAVLAVVVSLVQKRRGSSAGFGGQESGEELNVADADGSESAEMDSGESAESEDDGEDGGNAGEEDPKTEEELREEAEEKAVDAFDALTDKWMEKEGGEVSMKDMDEFVSSFKSVPGSRKEECLQRALNLVSDDHVLLLAGILFDKTVDKELVELVFNDVLNRDESVKKLILPKIYKDKEHPCWADTAWILDVTGETPTKENNQ